MKSFQSFHTKLRDFAGFTGILASKRNTKQTPRGNNRGRKNSGGWETVYDEFSGCYYRYNKKTQETEWVTDSNSLANQGEEDKWESTPENPVETRFDEASGCYYQVNMITGDSRWLDGNNDYDYDIDYAEYRAETNLSI